MMTAVAGRALTLLLLAVIALFATVHGDGEIVPLIDAEDIRSEVAFRWVRYCEILASRNRVGIRHALEFTAYNTLLRGCPQDKWDGITEKMISDMDGSWIVKLNGPRGWAFDTVGRNSTLVKCSPTDINGMDMVVVGIVEATVLDIATILMGGNNNYKPRTVQRRTIYVFFKNQPIFYLQSPEGRVFVMQSYSQQIFNVNKDNLPVLGPELKLLPAGWSYNYVAALATDLPLKAINDLGVIVNDDFMNVYSECDVSILHRAIGHGNRIVSFSKASSEPQHIEL